MLHTNLPGGSGDDGDVGLRDLTSVEGVVHCGQVAQLTCRSQQMGCFPRVEVQLVAQPALSRAVFVQFVGLNGIEFADAVHQFGLHLVDLVTQIAHPLAQFPCCPPHASTVKQRTDSFGRPESGASRPA
jgi:hypothetical protein